VPLPTSLVESFRDPMAPVDVREVLVESDARWLARAQAGELLTARVRLLGGSHSALAGVLGGSPDVAIYSGPVTTAGRVELLPFLREQAVSITAHRFGNPDAAMSSLPV
jgi:RHH-type proline utilization regulon transcriptional repressor/proline dehydrogenase/delta 1-pyrroline-5-carboxylate dehydrogenase